jgi:hypothetical protein
MDQPFSFLKDVKLGLPNRFLWAASSLSLWRSFEYILPARMIAVRRAAQIYKKAGFPHTQPEAGNDMRRGHPLGPGSRSFLRAALFKARLLSSACSATTCFRRLFSSSRALSLLSSLTLRPALFRLPVVVAGIAYAVPAAQLCYRGSGGPFLSTWMICSSVYFFRCI